MTEKESSLFPQQAPLEPPVYQVGETAAIIRYGENI
jgi:hypothetical protein